MTIYTKYSEVINNIAMLPDVHNLNEDQVTALEAASRALENMNRIFEAHIFEEHNE